MGSTGKPDSLTPDPPPPHCPAPSPPCLGPGGSGRQWPPCCCCPGQRPACAVAHTLHTSKQGTAWAHGCSHVRAHTGSQTHPRAHCRRGAAALPPNSPTSAGGGGGGPLGSPPTPAAGTGPELACMGCPAWCSWEDVPQGAWHWAQLGQHCGSATFPAPAKGSSDSEWPLPAGTLCGSCEPESVPW